MKRTAMKMTSAPWRRVRWVSLSLFLLVTARTNAPALSPVMPMASGQHRQRPSLLIMVIPARSLAWLPDGMRITSGSNDSTVQVWDAKTGHLLYDYNKNLP